MKLEVLSKRNRIITSVVFILIMLFLLCSSVTEFNLIKGINSIPVAIVWMFKNFIPDIAAFSKTLDILSKLIETILLAIAATILVGMHGAASLSNIICDPKDRHPDRKLSLLDSLANIDDLFGVLVLAKFPIVDKLHLDKILPIIYTFCGYRAGKSN